MRQPPAMRCSHDCGPCAISYVTGIDQDTVERVIGWQHYHGHGSVREDLQDSPWHHFDAIVRLGQTFRLRTCADLLSGRATPEKTVVLVHPDSRSPLLVQHWTVYAGLDTDGVPLLHWLDGRPPRRVPDLEELYSRGAPACAYEVMPDGGQKRLTWYQRLYVRVMGRFA